MTGSLFSPHVSAESKPGYGTSVTEITGKVCDKPLAIDGSARTVCIFNQIRSNCANFHSKPEVDTSVDRVVAFLSSGC
jgi:hypothetical protein